MSRINFHTHYQSCEAYAGLGDRTTLVVQSLMYDETPHERANYCTVGFHPLFLPFTPPENISLYLLNRREELGERFMGVGEIGWDRRSNFSWEVQDIYVEEQVKMATEYCLPVVFHMVGAWDRLFRLAKKIPPAQRRWWVHGFRGNPGLLAQLMQHRIAVSLSHKYDWRGIPDPDKILLETDEESPLFLEEVYQRAGKYYEGLEGVLRQNFSQLLP